MRGSSRWFAAFLCLFVLAGCRKDTPGSASLGVQTTLPEGIVVTLVSVDRPGTYVERSTSDLGGSLQYTGIKPGTYKLVYQFATADNIITRLPYNYGESGEFEVLTGRNRITWAPDTGQVSRLDK